MGRTQPGMAAPVPGGSGPTPRAGPRVESFPGVTSHSTRPLGNLIQVFLSMGWGGAPFSPGPRPG